MPYELVGKVPSVRAMVSTERTYDMNSRARDIARSHGREKYFLGTPRHDTGYVAQDRREMAGWRKNMFLRALDLFTLRKEYESEVGVYIETE